MVDWGAITLFMYITVRMSGFMLFNPVFGRRGFPGFFRAGMIMTLSVSVYSVYDGSVEVPGTLIEFALALVLELGIGFVIALLMRFFLFVPEQAGEIIDSQMALSMAQNYDPGAHASLTTSANLLNILMILTFFAANGHLTLLRLMLTSGDIVPFGAAAFGDAVAERMVEVFVECVLLSVKLCLPVLAAELMGQVGMGILMKVIPQINVFAINIELKVLIGLSIVMVLMSPISHFLLEVESDMLSEVRQMLGLINGS